MFTMFCGGDDITGSFPASPAATTAVTAPVPAPAPVIPEPAPVVSQPQPQPDDNEHEYEEEEQYEDKEEAEDLVSINVQSKQDFKVFRNLNFNFSEF